MIPKKYLKTYTSLLVVFVVAIIVAAQIKEGFTKADINEYFVVFSNDNAAGDLFGGAVDIDGNTAIVSAIYDDDDGTSSGSAYIFYNLGETWSQQAKLTASDGEAFDYFGRSVSISGDYAVVGGHGDDDNGSFSGSAYIFSRNEGGPDAWGEVAKLLASDGAASDWFGLTSSIDGDYAIVGTSRNDSYTGAAYIYYKDQDGPDAWGEVTKLTASDGVPDDEFGCSVSISGDYAVVGALGDENYIGAAYIFHNSGGTWSEVKKITASDGAVDDVFGAVVDISGNNVIVGTEVDSAYIFNKDEGGTDNWGEVKKLVANDGESGDHFGTGLIINGNYAIVGSPGDDGIGSAYIFHKDQGGTNSWGQLAKLVPSDGASEDSFGSVAIDGAYAIVGSVTDDNYNGVDAGSIYFFDVPPVSPSNFGITNITSTTATLTWDDNSSDETEFRIYQSTDSTQGSVDYTTAANAESQAVTISDTNPNYFWLTSYNSVTSQESIATSMCYKYSSTYGKMLPCDGEADDQFGYGVAVSGDYAVVGANYDDDAGTDSGAAYIFRKSGNYWVQVKKHIGNAAGDQYGASVAIDGDYIVVGSQFSDVIGSDYGAAFVYYKDEGGIGNWGLQSTLISSDANIWDYFGYSVSIRGDYIIVGNPYNDDAGGSSGAAYIFERTGSAWNQVAKLTASDAAGDDFFGYSVSTDGDYAIVGAYGDDDNGSSSGSAYIFEKDYPSADAWGQRSKLTASDGLANDWFGVSVAIDGNYAVVGAFYDDNVEGTNAGAIYLYERNGGTWDTETKILPNYLGSNYYFGHSVAIRGDYLLVGAYYYYSGYSYLFKKDDVSSDWGELFYFAGVDSASGDRFGRNVAIGDANLIVGSYLDDDNGDSSGSAYSYNYIDNISPEFSGLKNCVASVTTGDYHWLYAPETLALTTLSCDTTGFSGGITGNDAAYLTNLTSLTLTPSGPYGSCNSITGLGSGNSDLAGFAPGLTLTWTNNDTYSAGVAESAMNEIGILRGAGATVIHNINYEDCTNGIDDDDDGLIDSADIYCRGPQLYFDGETGTNNHECTETNPCDNLYNLMGSHWDSIAFRELNNRNAYSHLDVYVRGNGVGSPIINNMTGDPTTFSTITIQPWGDALPVIISSLYVYIPNVTVQGFEITNGVYIYGNDFTLKDSYIHGLSGIYMYGSNHNIYNNYINGINGYALYITGSGKDIYNNIISNSRYSAIYYVGSSNNTIINNTLYNNNTSLGGSYADIHIVSPGATVKQNLVYNNLGSETFNYNGGITVNDIATPSPLTGQTAADWGTGNNFIASADPFTNVSSATSWATAADAFRLISGALFGVSSPDLLTPLTDYLSETRDNVVAGALNFTSSGTV
ncbi:right-handed parallel beta-helix repeat-containing protein, partial [Candidatus Peregrinibacteria bacterium]|nr:right-handed parallel beta-helix repeat-containing protein [Candidatus Peregrinibacteria bacterium]